MVHGILVAKDAVGAGVNIGLGTYTNGVIVSNPGDTYTMPANGFLRIAGLGVDLAPGMGGTETAKIGIAGVGQGTGVVVAGAVATFTPGSKELIVANKGDVVSVVETSAGSSSNVFYCSVEVIY